MRKVYESIAALADYAQEYLELPKKNRDYALNTVFAILGLNSYAGESATTDGTLDTLLRNFVAACVDNNVFTADESEYYCDAVMGALTLPPDGVQKKFDEVFAHDGAKSATEWFYNYCVACDYVKKSKLDKNPRFEEGGLVITVNKAKPEFRDPKKAAAGNAVAGGYPKCSICHENEGFAGRCKRTLRTIDIRLGGEQWFWQFSPYGYFYQHGIAVNYRHTPMHVDKNTFVKLLDFVDVYPHYFIGCNAPLPRIGGSVLAHDHYQGGGEILPMHTAGAAHTLRDKNNKGVKIEVVDWAGTVVRVVSKDREAIVNLCERIRAAWEVYENIPLGIICEDADGKHSTVSPTVVKTARGYEMSLILRNNVCSEKYPEGVFHAHPEFHIIKKESIGLIEAQGLFILPGRLEGELEEIENLIVQDKPLSKDFAQFSLVYEETKALCCGDFSRDNVKRAMRKELASVCARILENTAVFKDKRQTVQFLKDLGFEND